MMTDEALKNGITPSYYREGMEDGEISARLLAEHAGLGDPTAISVYKKCGDYLGRGLSVIIDILNPERIVIGSIFARSSELLAPSMKESLNREALGVSADCCEIVPAELGESIGDVAAIAVGI
jgi:glucokinase